MSYDSITIIYVERSKKKCYKDFSDYMPFLLSLIPFLPSNCISSGPHTPLVPQLHPHLSGGDGDDDTQKFERCIQVS